MWWHKQRLVRVGRVIAPLALAALVGGCFQPLYAERSPPGGQALREQRSAVDIEQIVAPQGTDESRLAVEIRNSLLFDLTGGSGSAAPTHRLKISIASTRTSIIVDIQTSRPDIENY